MENKHSQVDPECKGSKKYLRSKYVVSEQRIDFTWGST